MSEIKYEAVFGDQSLFDGAPEDAEYAGWFCQEVRWYMILNGKILFSDGGSWCTSDNPYLSADIAAMRRIIKVPVWKKADKLAGKLPDVGCKAVQIQGLCEVDVLMIHNGCVVVCNSEISDSRPAVLKIDSFMELFTPLETPAEKAQRLRSEWCSKALDSAGILSEMKRYELKRLGEYIGSIHDALLSGELKAPGME